jgi:hypothetical protein
MSAHPMPGLNPTYVVPVSSGIFKHCAKIGVAVWVFLWMIDRTTKEIPTADGQAEGLVLNGRPIRAQEIALELQMGARTVQTHLNHLVAAGYLRRLTQNFGSASGYAVLKSKKWKPKLAIISGKRSEAGDVENSALISAQAPLISAQGAPISALPPQNSAEGAPKSAALYRNNTQTTHRLNTVEDFVLTGEAPESDEQRIMRLVDAGWQYFLEKTDKSPKQYSFRPSRKKMGLEGFEALIGFARDGQHPDPYTAAGELFRVAVDRLARSPWHNGVNDAKKKYLDWHQLFKGKEFEAPTKLLEFWLDDSRWPA